MTKIKYGLRNHILSPYFPFSHHAQIFRSIDPKMPSVKRRTAAAGQNSSAHTGHIKTSLTGSAFSADISLYLVAAKTPSLWT